uniref:7TM_GPCR_Srx domain-containing protein n=1 Tax=Brugia timori TaxID=42155 RepID=A0A0R3QKM5_9BILA
MAFFCIILSMKYLDGTSILELRRHMFLMNSSSCIFNGFRSYIFWIAGDAVLTSWTQCSNVFILLSARPDFFISFFKYSKYH